MICQIYRNYLNQYFMPKIRIFFQVILPISDLSDLMNSELKKLSSWLAINKLTLNTY